VTDKRNKLLRLISTVDGLVRCNVKAGADIIRGGNSTLMNVTQSLPDDEKRQRGRDHFSGDFTIVEGEPFTTTLWAGVEGFHMTVNGRHETSFAYREVRLCNEMRLDTSIYISIA
jgi:hydroxyproline O-galactosyltransferase 2/3/4/5/6